MIKIIDQSGKVLVMRPDVTIPITRQVAAKYPEFTGEIRYFYVTDVFRQTPGETNNKERTQAGIEYFGNTSPEADADRSEEHTSELQSRGHLVCRLLLEKKKYT